MVQRNSLNNDRTVQYFSDYDDYLNPRKKYTRYSQNLFDLVATDSSVISYKNNVNIARNIIGLPEEIKQYKLRPGENPILHTKKFAYSQDGKTHKTYLEENSNDELETEYSYDQFGNITRIKKTATLDTLVPQNMRTRETSFNYSTDGRFLVSKVSPGGIRDSMVYNDFGWKIKDIDVNNNLTTTYEYDGFGNLTRSDYPDTREILQGIRWVNNTEHAPADALYYSFSQSYGFDPEYTFYDKQGREIRSVTRAYNGNTLYADKLYDKLGRDSLTSMPYFKDATNKYWTRYYYDDLGRVDSVVNPDGKFTAYHYNGRTTTVKTGKGSTYQETTKTVNALGETILSQDNDGKKVETEYYSSGLPREITLNNGPVVQLEYDIYGNRTRLVDPDAGEIKSYYDVFGQLVKQVDAKGNETEYSYDPLGRVVTETLGNSTKSYTYDNGFTGAVSSVSQTSPGDSIAYSYDELGRLTSTTEYYDGMQVTNSFEYDYLGRLKKQTLPGNIPVYRYYDANGYLSRISALNKDLWQCNDMNELGQVTAFKSGSKNSTVEYDYTGMLEEQSYAANTKNFIYGFDDLSNLSYRKDVKNGRKEIFAYDDMNRLTGSNYYINDNLLGQNLSITYDSDGRGNIESKSGVSSHIAYGEGDAGPHALTSVSEPDSAFNPWPQHISYTPFNKVATIIDTLDNNDSLKLVIEYGYDNQRRKSVLIKPGDSTKTKYFFGNYEKITDASGQKEYYFINSPSGLCAIIESYQEGGETVQKVWHTYTDHLGSLVYIEDGDDETNYRHYSYDSWGNPRNHEDWLSDSLEYDLIADRGYTSHEHLTEFGLINMNGRVYDPVLGRFLSPDPFVQMPGTVSGYNRYAYVHNNPLTYIDPTGYRRNKPMSAGLQEFYAFMKEYNSGAGGGLGHLLGRGFDYSKYQYGGHFGWHGGAFNPFYRYNYKKGQYETHLGQEVSYAQVHNNIVIQNIDRNAKLIVWTYNGRGSYVDNKSAVRANPIGSLYVFSFFEYDKAYDINVASSGGYANSWISDFWNNSIITKVIPDVIYINTGAVYNFVGGGAANTGYALPLRGKDAGHLYLTTTFIAKAGAHGNIGINVGYSSYVGDARNFDFDESFGGIGTRGFDSDIFFGFGGTVSQPDISGNRLYSYDIGFGSSIGASANIGSRTYVKRIW